MTGSRLSFRICKYLFIQPTHCLEKPYMNITGKIYLSSDIRKNTRRCITANIFRRGSCVRSILISESLCDKIFLCCDCERVRGIQFTHSCDFVVPCRAFLISSSSRACTCTSTRTCSCHSTDCRWHGCGFGICLVSSILSRGRLEKARLGGDDK